MSTKKSSDPEISLVIPVFDEAHGIPLLVTELKSELEEHSKSYEIILIDDGSRDRSWAVIGEQAEEHKEIRGVRLSRNFGKENALCAGLEISRGKAVVVMDADLQHPPKLLKTMIERWRSGEVEVVEAVRRERATGDSWNNLCAHIFYWFISRFSGFELKGATDYKLVDRSVVEAWKELGERTVFFRGMVAWLGFRRAQIHFTPSTRKHGKSHWTIASLVKLALNAITSFTSLPLRLVTCSGVIFFLFSVLLGLETLYMKYFGGAVDGFTTVIICLLFVGSIIMFALGVIGEYLARIYDEVKRRPRYLVSDRTER